MIRDRFDLPARLANDQAIMKHSRIAGYSNRGKIIAQHYRNSL